MTTRATHSSASATVPRHIAVIMDGNGRWARRRHLPRSAGHRAGQKAVRAIIEQCARRGVDALTLFAFSSENWQRPDEEIGNLMGLFLKALNDEVPELHKQQVRLRFIGALEQFSDKLRAGMQQAEQLTQANPGLQLQVAIGYGGRWDITQATQRLAQRVATGELEPASITEEDVAQARMLADIVEPDLFIRTGGEQRISNFLLWDLAYTELYFCDTLWPDFDAAALDAALAWFASRERRFGMTSEQRRQDHA